MWITNCPTAAAILKEADERYAQAKTAAQGKPLPEKIAALRQAKQARAQAYAQAQGA